MSSINDLILSTFSLFCLDEAAVYDRQIRLWGLEAQQRSVKIPKVPLQTSFDKITHFSAQNRGIIFRYNIGCEMRQLWSST